MDELNDILEKIADLDNEQKAKLLLGLIIAGIILGWILTSIAKAIA